MSFLEHLHHLPAESQTYFFNNGREQAYPKDTWLPGPAEGFHGIRLILEGSVHVFASVDNRDIPVYCYGHGEALGIRSFLMPENQPSLKWQAASDCIIYELDAAEARSILSDDKAAGPIREIFDLAAHLRDLDIMLAIHPLFQTLPEDARHTLFRDAEPIALTPGQMLIKKGQSNDALYFICHGGVDIINDDQVIAHRSQGEILGEVSALGFAPTANVRSTGWTDVLAFSRQAMLETCQQQPAFSAKLASFGISGFE